jgi:hypothetical protein
MIPLFLVLALVPAPATLMRTVVEGTDSPLRERLEIVVKTPEEWQALWKRFAPERRPEAVDFEHEMVVGVFLGSHPVSGYRVEIFSVAREEGVIVVRYHLRAPREGTVLTLRESAPYQLVAVPRDARRIRFVEVRALGKTTP